MVCRTCGIEGHDSQGNKDLCLVAVVDRCRRMECQSEERRKALSAVMDLALSHLPEVVFYSSSPPDTDPHGFREIYTCAKNGLKGT